MSDSGDSELIPQEELQLGFEIIRADDHRRSNPVFTGARVARDVQRYDAIVSALAEGMSIRQVARAYRCSPGTVQTVRERESARLGTEKEENVRRIGRIVRLGLERVEEAIERDEIKPEALALQLAILIDKRELLSGGVTARTETVQRGMSHEEIATQYLAGLKSASDSQSKVNVLE